MSHNKERSEKICLNCGAELIDRYCQKCGQENIEPKPTLGHLIKHFFNDVTHFDGRFFSTMKMLIMKPGFLSSEYLKGLRTSYLDPIRMFLFISAIFFLLPAQYTEKEEWRKKETPNAKLENSLNKAQQSITQINKALKEETVDTISSDSSEVLQLNTNGNAQLNTGEWAPEETLAEYDSVQHSLPDKKRDGWIEHYFKRKVIGARELSHENTGEFKSRVSEKIAHATHYMLFFTLPLIALILKLLYIRRKQYYYVSHIIFVLHYYCVLFMLLIISSLLSMIGGYVQYAAFAVHLGYFIYLFVAMKRFYQQGVFKTFVKYILLLFTGGVVLMILTLIVLINSLLNVAV